MTRLFAILLTASIFLACSEENAPPITENNCSIPAIVVDLTGLDGCGFAFELEDGTRLLPVKVLYCGTYPLPDNLPPDPIHTFEFVAGKKVFIEYTVSENYAGACMAGQYVSVTCISETPGTQAEI
jgi:hypothetical protein